MYENGRGSFVCRERKHMESSGILHYALAQVNPPRTERFFLFSSTLSNVKQLIRRDKEKQRRENGGDAPL